MAIETLETDPQNKFPEKAKYVPKLSFTKQIIEGLGPLNMKSEFSQRLDKYLSELASYSDLFAVAIVAIPDQDIITPTSAGADLNLIAYGSVPENGERDREWGKVVGSLYSASFNEQEAPQLILGSFFVSYNPDNDFDPQKFEQALKIPEKRSQMTMTQAPHTVSLGMITTQKLRDEMAALSKTGA